MYSYSEINLYQKLFSRILVRQYFFLEMGTWSTLKWSCNYTYNHGRKLTKFFGGTQASPPPHWPYFLVTQNIKISPNYYRFWTGGTWLTFGGIKSPKVPPICANAYNEMKHKCLLWWFLISNLIVITYFPSIYRYISINRTTLEKCWLNVRKYNFD